MRIYIDKDQPAGEGKALSSVVPRAVGAGAAVGSVPQDVYDLIPVKQ